ncbi:MAG: PTS sugar transporter subunit IIA [bacterium]|nr:PTS sugar transporter subunit IIA [bacterium]
MDKWDRILRPDNIVVGLRSQRKFDALRELTAVFDDDSAVTDPKAFLTKLITREKQSSTGIGKGVAVPHAHEESIRRQVLAIGISHEGIEFDSVDGEPVYVVAVLGTPMKHQKQHMELLAALSRLLQNEDVRQMLVAAGSIEEVLSIFKSASS